MMMDPDNDDSMMMMMLKHYGFRSGNDYQGYDYNSDYTMMIMMMLKHYGFRSVNDIKEIIMMIL